MKKLTRSLILALAVIMMTQCRKGVDPDYNLQDNGGEKITFSLNAGGGSSNGTRTEITQDGAALTMTWSAGDVIYVAGSEQAYLGFITLTSGEGTTEASFQGEIKAITEPQDLHLYYLGKNNGVERTISAENSTTINISSQSGTLDDIENYHIASATVSNVAAGTTDLSATFNTDIAILKFDLAGYAAGTKLYGTSISKTLTLNLKTGTLTGDNSATDYDSGIEITIPANANSTFVALLPGTVTMTLKDNNGKTETYSNKTLTANTFYSDGGDGITTIPAGALSGIFTVGMDGSTPRQVRFSQGNLWYQAGDGTNSIPKWALAPRQYDYLGTTSANSGSGYTSGNETDGNESRSTQAAWIDLFGWGTSGWNNGNTDYQPWTFNKGDMFVGFGYGPTDGSNYGYDLTGTYANSDWGVYLTSPNTEQICLSPAITDKLSGSWRTLTNAEWIYLCSRRYNMSYYLVGYGSLTTDANGDAISITGCFIMPDNYASAYTENTGWSMTYEQLTTAGAVFLPAAGFRDVFNVYLVGSEGTYWSSSCSGASGAKYMIFNSNEVNSDNGYFRYLGQSVRLVQDLK